MQKRLYKFIPNWTRKQFVNWANKRYPNNKHNSMKKKQLIAIYLNTN
jgi:hypothetical protein